MKKMVRFYLLGNCGLVLGCAATLFFDYDHNLKWARIPSVCLAIGSIIYFLMIDPPRVGE